MQVLHRSEYEQLDSRNLLYQTAGLKVTKHTTDSFFDDEYDEGRGQECEAKHHVERYHKGKYLVIDIVYLKNVYNVSTF